jgi:hypothetical protein
LASPALVTAVTRVDSAGVWAAAVATGAEASDAALPGPLAGSFGQLGPKGPAASAAPADALGLPLGLVPVVPLPAWLAVSLPEQPATRVMPAITAAAAAKPRSLFTCLTSV